jgi:CsoR family transcriptional regulator, copper-sensing transcriptional repressor
MKLKNADSKEKLNQRLRRIEGQVRGVQNMLDEERECQEIMQQLSAIRSALQSVSRIFLQEYASECLLDLNADEEEGLHSSPEIRVRREKMIQEMITFLDKAS